LLIVRCKSTKKREPPGRPKAKKALQRVFYCFMSIGLSILLELPAHDFGQLSRPAGRGMHPVMLQLPPVLVAETGVEVDKRQAVTLGQTAYNGDDGPADGGVIDAPR
jgi:hypothetical protein